MIDNKGPKSKREKEGCRFTRQPSSEGIETDLTLDRRPIPPPWHRVVPSIGMRSTQEFGHHKGNRLDVVE